MQTIKHDAKCYSIVIRDKGHTLICPVCAARFGFDEKLIGKPRELSYSVCEICSQKKTYDKTHGRWVYVETDG